MEVLEITRQKSCKLPRRAASVLFTSSPLRFLLLARLQEADADNNSKRGTKNFVLEEKRHCCKEFSPCDVTKLERPPHLTSSLSRVVKKPGVRLVVDRPHAFNHLCHF